MQDSNQGRVFGEHRRAVGSAAALPNCRTAIPHKRSENGLGSQDHHEDAETASPGPVGEEGCSSAATVATDAGQPNPQSIRSEIASTSSS